MMEKFLSDLPDTEFVVILHPLFSFNNCLGIEPLKLLSLEAKLGFSTAR